MRKKKDETDNLLDSISNGIFVRKGLDVVKIDLRNLENSIADYFIICHGTSKTHVDSISSSVEEFARKEAGEKPIRIEGLENCFWVLVDFGNVIVHIFQEEYRNFYSLESLWADAVVTRMAEKREESALTEGGPKKREKVQGRKVVKRTGKEKEKK